MSIRTILLVAAGALVLAPPATAHITANPTEVPAGGFAMVAFRVPHGCEDSPTISVRIKIPDGVVSVTPQAVPGWKVTTKQGELAEPVELHGETITEGVQELTWTGGPLDPHEFTDFGLSMRMPDTPGETLWFPAIQRCQQGETRWIQIPVEGEAEPEEPAPAVVLTESAGENGAAAETESDVDERLAALEQELAAPEAEAAPEGNKGNGMETLALGFGIAGLVAGLAALGLGLLRRSRRA